MRVKAAYIYLSLFVIHSLVALLTFRHSITEPDKYTYCDYGDGVKNHFTLYSYVKEPVGKEGFLKYNSMNYPFGDYVLYTDNTPLFSIPFKWFCLNIYDASEHTVALFNWIVIFNIVIAGLLVFYAFSYLLQSRAVAYILAITLPWINIQVLRVWRGHFNLSFSVFVLAAICLLILWHKNKNGRTRFLIGSGMWLLSFCSFLAHGYYLAIIVLFLSASLFFSGIAAWKCENDRRTIILSVVLPLVTGISVYLFIAATDGYLGLRPTTNLGYDWMEYKTRVSALFSPYYFHTFHFSVKGLVDTSDERSAYMGNMALFSFAVMTLLCVFSTSIRRNTWQIQKHFFRDPLKAGIFLGSLLMLFVAMGEHYYTDTGEKGYLIYNVLNPFFYLHIVTNMVEQFRCLGRFVWPFYFGFTLWVVYSLIKLTEYYTPKIQKIAVILIACLGCYEMVDFCKELNKRNRRENFFTRRTRHQFNDLHLNYDMYQAILPIPYFHIGSETPTYNIEDIEEWSNYCYRLNMHSGLPLMACKLSRTPPIYAGYLLSAVAEGKIDSPLYQKLNSKKILVAVNKSYIADSNRGPSGEAPSRAAYLMAVKFAEREQLQAVDSLKDVVFYEWQPKHKQ